MLRNWNIGNILIGTWGRGGGGGVENIKYMNKYGINSSLMVEIYIINNNNSFLVNHILMNENVGNILIGD